MHLMQYEIPIPDCYDIGTRYDVLHLSTPEL